MAREETLEIWKDRCLSEVKNNERYCDRIDQLVSKLRWVRDAVDHCGSDADREQIEFIQRAIDVELK